MDILAKLEKRKQVLLGQEEAFRKIFVNGLKPPFTFRKLEDIERERIFNINSDTTSYNNFMLSSCMEIIEQAKQALTKNDTTALASLRLLVHTSVGALDAVNDIIKNINNLDVIKASYDSLQSSIKPKGTSPYIYRESYNSEFRKWYEMMSQ